MRILEPYQRKSNCHYIHGVVVCKMWFSQASQISHNRYICCVVMPNYVAFIAHQNPMHIEEESFFPRACHANLIPTRFNVQVVRAACSGKLLLLL